MGAGLFLLLLVAGCSGGGSSGGQLPHEDRVKIEDILAKFEQGFWDRDLEPYKDIFASRVTIVDEGGRKELDRDEAIEDISKEYRLVEPGITEDAKVTAESIVSDGNNRARAQVSLLLKWSSSSARGEYSVSQPWFFQKDRDGSWKITQIGI